MGFSSMDDLVSKQTAGNYFRLDWNKAFLPTTAAVAGEWHCLVNGAGYPQAGSIYDSGTNLEFQATSDTTSGAGGMFHGGDVSPSTKHILNASVYTASTTTTPCVLVLVDLLGFYRITSVTTTTAQTLDNTVTIPRYTTGEGVRAFMFNNSSTALGSASPNLSINYTNQAGTSGRVTPTVLPIGKSQAANGLILYSGSGYGKYGPFMPLAGSDSGIRTVESITISSSYVSGTFSLVLCRPLITMPIITQGVACERDFVNQLPSLPRVYDGANLVWLFYSGANTPVNTPYYGHIDFAWG